MPKKIDSWLPLYVADYLADTTRLSTEQHGAYLLIIMDYWRNGPPPDDDAVLAQITGLPAARWKAHRAVIERFFAIKNGIWTQKRIEKELAKAKHNNDQKSEAGRASAAKRWGNGNDDGGNNGKVTGVITEDVTSAVTEVITNGSRQNAPSPSPKVLPSPAPSPPPPPAPKAKVSARKRATPAKTPMPEDFSISDRVRKWANEKGFSMLDAHLEHFAGKARAKAYAYADWDEALMCAIRDDWAGLRKRNGAGNHDAAIAEAERQIFGESEKDVTHESERI